MAAKAKVYIAKLHFWYGEAEYWEGDVVTVNDNDLQALLDAEIIAEQ